MNPYVVRTETDPRQIQCRRTLPVANFDEESTPRRQHTGRLLEQATVQIQAVRSAVESKLRLTLHFRLQIADLGGGNVR